MTAVAHDDGFTREHAVPLPEGVSPRIVIFAVWNDAYAPLAEITRPNWKAYCEARGYALRFYPGEFHLDPQRPDTYGDKGRFRLYYDLRGHADIVMYLDIDSLFTNVNERIEDRLYGSRRFWWTYDDSGPLSGLWIARTDEETERHLRAAYELAAIESNVRRGVIEPNGISDQDAMRRLMNTPPFSATFGKCWPAKAAGHCFPETWYPGAWLVTFPGRSVEEKAREMEDWVKRI